MDMKWLRTFVTAAHYENFRKTAEVLFLAQPTVTVHIKRLEETLGLPLFTRSGRNVILTDGGRRFLTYAKEMIKSYDEGVHDLQSWRQGYYKKLIIAVSPLIAASILPYILGRFVEEYREIEIVVRVMESVDIGHELVSGKADLGLSRLKPIQAELTSWPLYSDQVVLVAPHDGGDFESSPPLEMDELLETSIVFTYNHPAYWDDLLTDLRLMYHRLRTMVVSQVHITKRFIEEGLGVSFLPRSTVRRELLEGRMLEIDTPQLQLPTAATYVVTRQETFAVHAFKVFLQNHFA